MSLSKAEPFIERCARTGAPLFSDEKFCCFQLTKDRLAFKIIMQQKD